MQRFLLAIASIAVTAACLTQATRSTAEIYYYGTEEVTPICSDVAECNALIRKDPNNIGNRKQRANFLLKEKKFRISLIDINRILLKSRDDIDALCMRSVANISLSNISGGLIDARKFMQRAMKSRAVFLSFHGCALEQIVDALIASKKQPQALSLLTEQTKSDEGNVGRYSFELGKVLSSQNDLIAAVKAYEITAANPNVTTETKQLATSRIAALSEQLARHSSRTAPNEPVPPTIPAPGPSAPSPAEAKPPAPSATITSSPRLALVIGNAAYENVPKLRNPTIDADAIAAKLKLKGFAVTEVLNAGKSKLFSEVNTFLRSITKDSEVFVYYSGHGVELDGANYAVPVDVPALSADAEELIKDRSLNLTALLVDIGRRDSAATVVVLDACRDNPFRDVRVAGLSKALGGKDGLAPVAAPRGVFVLYSAGVNEKALDRLGFDDAEPNGLFTRKLLPLMDEPGLEIRTMATRLRREVSAAAKQVKDLDSAGHRQSPASYDQMDGDFFFTPTP